MKWTRMLAVLLVASTLSGFWSPRDSYAQMESPAAETVYSSDPGSIDDETRLGVLAAVGCGFMVRATIATGGAFAGTIAGAIATCGFMVFDAIFL